MNKKSFKEKLEEVRKIQGEEAAKELMRKKYGRQENLKKKKYFSENYIINEIAKISFPRDEHASLMKRLDAHKTIHTLRTGKEYSLYNVGDVLETPWGQQVKVIKSKKLKGINDYKFFDDFTPEQSERLTLTQKIRHIELKKV
jgi:hypothetical protein